MTGPEIKALRLKLGLTQTGLAKELGVEYHAIIAWEKGRRKPLPVFDQMLYMISVYGRQAEVVE